MDNVQSFKEGLVLHRKPDAPKPTIPFTRPNIITLKSGNRAGWTYTATMYRVDGTTFEHLGWLNKDIIDAEYYYDTQYQNKKFTRQRFLKLK